MYLTTSYGPTFLSMPPRRPCFFLASATFISSSGPGSIQAVTSTSSSANRVLRLRGREDYFVVHLG